MHPQSQILPSLLTSLTTAVAIRTQVLPLPIETSAPLNIINLLLPQATLVPFLLQITLTPLALPLILGSLTFSKANLELSVNCVTKWATRPKFAAPNPNQALTSLGHTLI